MRRLERRRLLKSASIAAGGLALTGPISLASAAGAQSTAPQRSTRAGAGTVIVRWIGGGVVELATPDNKQLAFVDAWVWNNAAYTVMMVDRPPEFASARAFGAYVAAKSPEAILVLLSHDHGDHIGDYFEMLKTLVNLRLPVKTTGQSDLMRGGLLPRFREAGLDPAQLIVNGGAAQNFGGRARHGAMQTWLVPAIHSNLLGFPAAGFVLEIGGVRVYASGDTDLFGDMQLIGERYHPDIALVCTGDGPFTMGPQDAALACRLTGVSQAVPIHYGHNTLVLGAEAARQFRAALEELSPNTTAQVIPLGASRAITVRSENE